MQMISRENAGDAVLKYDKPYARQGATPAATEEAHSYKAPYSIDLLFTLSRRWKEPKLS